MARILIIDVDPQGLASMKQALQDTGYEVVTAANGREGLQQYRLQPADLLITDLLVPEGDGRGMIQYLTHLAPDLDGLEMIEHLIRQFPAVNILAMSRARVIICR